MAGLTQAPPTRRVRVGSDSWELHTHTQTGNLNLNFNLIDSEPESGPAAAPAAGKFRRFKLNFSSSSSGST